MCNLTAHRLAEFSLDNNRLVRTCILGWAAASFRGWTVYLFGFIPLPGLAEEGTPWADTAGDVHDVLLYILLVPIALHVVAAFYHQYVLRDRLLERMGIGREA